MWPREVGVLTRDGRPRKAIAVGIYVTLLLKQAKDAAREIGAEVDAGDTACQVQLAARNSHNKHPARRTLTDRIPDMQYELIALGSLV